MEDTFAAERAVLHTSESLSCPLLLDDRSHACRRSAPQAEQIDPVGESREIKPDVMIARGGQCLRYASSLGSMRVVDAEHDVRDARKSTRHVDDVMERIGMA